MSINKFDELIEAIKERGIQETAYENMKLTKENQDLQTKIDKAIEHIKDFEIQAKHINDEIYLDEALSNKLLEILGGKE